MQGIDLDRRMAVYLSGSLSSMIRKGVDSVVGNSLPTSGEINSIDGVGQTLT